MMMQGQMCAVGGGTLRDWNNLSPLAEIAKSSLFSSSSPCARLCVCVCRNMCAWVHGMRVTDRLMCATGLYFDLQPRPQHTHYTYVCVFVRVSVCVCVQEWMYG